MIVFCLLSVAFFTLIERKILALNHLRLGPNRVRFFGLLQPIRDAFKLFSKEDTKIRELNFFIFLFSSFLCIFLRLFLWGILPFWGVLFFSKYSIMFFICVVGIGVYFLLFIGWCRRRKYRLLGCYRSSSQRISYEVIIIFCVLFFIYLIFCLDFISILFFSTVNIIFLFSTLLFFSWVMSCLAERNRSPFDFSEGESELVSGFNTEYRGGLFSLIFIGEYRSILVLSFVTSFVFFAGFSFYIFFIMISYFYLWVRASFPRLRYDLLIIIAWKAFSILILSCFLNVISFF